MFIDLIKKGNGMEQVECKLQLTLRDFAYTGNNEFYFNKLADLADLAEPETWTIDERYPLGVLKYYIDKTFERAYITDCIISDAQNRYCCFNTGLLSRNYEAIIALFRENDMPDKQKWYFTDFVVESNREFLDKFYEIPPLVKFYDHYSELIFNPNQKIVLNNNHIIEENWERFPIELQRIGKPGVFQMLKGVLETTYKLIERNFYIAIPQVYKNKIMFLLPLNIPIGEKIYPMALAIEKINEAQYRANTILTIDMAYSSARLITRLENSWLKLPEKNIIQ